MTHVDLFTSVPSDTTQKAPPLASDVVPEADSHYTKVDLEPAQTLCARLGAAMTHELMRPSHASIEVLKDVERGPYEPAAGTWQTAVQLRRGAWGVVLEVTCHEDAPRVRVTVDPVVVPSRVGVDLVTHDGLAHLQELIITARALVGVMNRVAAHPGAWRWEDVRV